MSRFVVRFMKDVLGYNGREIEICQSSLEVDASTESQATELAKKKFCETEALCEWSLHADRIQVREAEFPSR
jgi:hypothetical protein